MPAINKIHIIGFKAFPNDFELKLEGKNLLMYGQSYYKKVKCGKI